MAEEERSDVHAVEEFIRMKLDRLRASSVSQMTFNLRSAEK
jgi:hypothetical protein